MSLSDLASLGSFTSGVAVMLTLVFLVLQMRQSNLNQRALMQQGRSTRASGTILNISEPYAAQCYVRGVRADPTLSEHEVWSFWSMVTAQHLNWEDSYLQHRAGMLDAESFASDDSVLRVTCGFAGHRRVWRFVGPTLAPAYRAYVDGIIAATPLAEPIDFAALWAQPSEAAAVASDEPSASTLAPEAGTQQAD
jgi:hypothetical protein